MTAGVFARPAFSPLRKDLITASRLPVVLGLSPYLTPNALMRQMVREHFGDPDEFVGTSPPTGATSTRQWPSPSTSSPAEWRVWCSGARQRALVHPLFVQAHRW